MFGGPFLWDEAAGRLRAKVSPQNFEMWLRPIESRVVRWATLRLRWRTHAGRCSPTNYRPDPRCRPAVRRAGHRGDHALPAAAAADQAVLFLRRVASIGARVSMT